jgi:ABC-type sugar transport system permease subunit
MEQTLPQQTWKKRLKKAAFDGKFFYAGLVAIPLIQFFLFYIVANFNNILLAFKNYDNSTGAVIESWVGWKNFDKIWQIFRNESTLWICIQNSFVFLAIDLLIILPFSLFFAYYIHKKRPFAELFKALLFIPSVICSMVFVIFYLNFAENVIPLMAKAWFQESISNIFHNPSLGLRYLCIFYVWITFSGQILLYVNAMDGVSPAVVEAAEIDGANEFKIFWHVMVPGCYKTIVSLAVISLAGLVSNQAYLFSFYGIDAPGAFQTLGYFQFVLVTQGKGAEDPTNYPLASAFGLICTLFAIPLTFGARYLLNKLGPKEE